jgi:hypothetical protein
MTAPTDHRENTKAKKHESGVAGNVPAHRLGRAMLLLLAIDLALGVACYVQRQSEPVPAPASQVPAIAASAGDSALSNKQAIASESVLKPVPDSVIRVSRVWN